MRLTENIGYLKRLLKAHLSVYAVAAATYDCRPTAIRPRYDHSTTYVTTVWHYRNSIIFIIIILAHQHKHVGTKTLRK